MEAHLSAEDKKRVWQKAEEHDKNLIDTYNWSGDMAQSFFDGAEYATLHERSAAQARIAELEKMLEQFTYYGLIHTVNGVVPADYDSHEDLIKKAKLIFQKQP